MTPSTSELFNDIKRDPIIFAVSDIKATLRHAGKIEDKESEGKRTVKRTVETEDAEEDRRQAILAVLEYFKEGIINGDVPMDTEAKELELKIEFRSDEK